VPANIPKIVLRKLLIENMNTASTDVPQIVENDNADTGTIFAESPNNFLKTIFGIFAGTLIPI
jgi:hypothetical protein